MTDTRPVRSRSRAVLGLTLGALVLAGCAEPLPVPDPAPAPVLAQPVVDVAQEDSILDAVGQALENAAEDPAALEGRLSGPALVIRTSELAVAAETDSADLLTALPTEAESVVITTDQDWPRISYAISVQPDLQTQRLLVLEQSSARANYKLWGWVRLFPAIELERFTDASVGSSQVAADSDALVMTPQEAIERYADVLTKGGESDYAEQFPDDVFRQQMAEISRLQNEALAPADGRQTMTFTPVEGSVRAISTANGGALVVGEMTALEDRTAEEGATISPASAVERALLAGKTVENSMSIGYTSTVAIYLPPAGSDDQPAVVGVEHVATSADVPG